MREHIWITLTISWECESKSDVRNIEVFGATAWDWRPHLMGIFPVDPLVDVEVWALAEALPTLVAFMRLLTRVDWVMNERTWTPGEALPTLTALTRLLVCMDLTGGWGDCSSWWSPSRTAHICRAFLRCGPSDEGLALSTHWSPYHTDYVCSLSLKGGSSHQGDHLGWYMFSHSLDGYRASPLYELSDDDDWPPRISNRKRLCGYSQRAPRVLSSGQYGKLSPLWTMARPLLSHQPQVYLEGSLNNAQWEDFFPLSVSPQCFLQLQTSGKSVTFLRILGLILTEWGVLGGHLDWDFQRWIFFTLHVFLNHHSEESPHCLWFLEISEDTFLHFWQAERSSSGLLTPPFE